MIEKHNFYKNIFSDNKSFLELCRRALKMNNDFLNYPINYTIEPPLWFMVSGILAIITIYFINKYIKFGKINKEARPFILGIAVFIGSYIIARTIETIRRYWIGSYYDIITATPPFTITGLNLILRLSYYIISWTSITFFYYMFEQHVMKKGMKKNTHYVLTIFSAAEGIFSCLLYFTAAAAWVMYGVICFFFVIVFFPIIFFLYLSKMAPTKGQQIGWIFVTIGFILVLLGIMLDLPESYWVVTHYMGSPFFPPELIHYGTPILQAAGAILLGIAFANIYKNV